MPEFRNLNFIKSCIFKLKHEWMQIVLVNLEHRLLQISCKKMEILNRTMDYDNGWCLSDESVAGASVIACRITRRISFGTRTFCGDLLSLPSMQTIKNIKYAPKTIEFKEKNDIEIVNITYSIRQYIPKYNSLNNYR